MFVVPVQAIPNQQLQVELAAQPCTLNIYQYAYGLFMDVYIATTPIVVGVICEDRNRIIRGAYLGFIGDFAWLDLSGRDDPVYTGIGSRFQLIYVEASDLISLGLV